MPLASCCSGFVPGNSRSTFFMASQVALLAEHRIVFFGTPEEMKASDDRYIRDFLGGF